MSDIAIKTTGLRKVYHIYDSPLYRALDAFGPTRRFARGHYREFEALKPIDLEIRRGSRTAIIGQNGAGKSTLLKLISGNLTPTSGNIEVHGKVTALFTLGTGFHPDLTGRRNLEVTLAYQGIVGREADRVMDAIIDFAELGDFIDQPVSTYSAGMYMRLGFSANIFIKPDILILDEVLSVGDAYFNSKCVQEIRKMTGAEQSTLLLVTHDLYQAQSFCDEFIWMKNGQIHMTGNAIQVTSAYEADTKLREEARLRQLNQTAQPAARAPVPSTRSCWGELIQEDNHPLTGKLIVSRIDLMHAGKVLQSINMEANSLQPHRVLVETKDSSWGELTEVDGEMARGFSNMGNVFHKAPFRFELPRSIPPEDVAITVRCKDLSPDRIRVRWGESPEDIHTTPVAQLQEDGQWKTLEFPMQATETKEEMCVAASRTPQPEDGSMGRASTAKRYGNGKVRIVDLQILNADGEPRWVHQVCDPLTLVIAYEVNQETLPVQVHLALGILNEQGTKVMNPTTLSQGKLTLHKKKGTIQFTMDSCLLNRGEYNLTLALFKELSPNNDNSFYTGNDAVYDILAYAYNFKIVGGLLTEQGIYQQPGHWAVG